MSGRNAIVAPEVGDAVDLEPRRERGQAAPVERPRRGGEKPLSVGGGGVENRDLTGPRGRLRPGVCRGIELDPTEVPVSGDV